MASPGDYQHFRGIVPERKIQVGMHQNKHFRYYEFGPKRLDPLICLGGAASTADCFYKQVLALSSKGYRIMAVDAPALWTHAEWMAAFDKFLDSLRINQVHLYGTSLGGFLCQLYAAYRPRRVRSLVLSNTFLDTKNYHEELSWSSLFQWTPEFMLKRIIMAGLGEGYREAHIANSIDFVVSQLETLHQQELASRLTLMSQLGAVGHIHVSDDVITIMDTNDYCAVKQDARDALYIRYPGARRAFLKSGGDFPFLSRADEVNLHLQLHLRRVGVEPDASAASPAPSPARETVFSSSRYDSDTTTTSADEGPPLERPSRREQSGGVSEAPPAGHDEQRAAPHEEESVGAHLAYKKDPLWAALADAEASVWEDALEERAGSGRGGTPGSKEQEKAHGEGPRESEPGPEAQSPASPDAGKTAHADQDVAKARESGAPSDGQGEANGGQEGDKERAQERHGGGAVAASGESDEGGSSEEDEEGWRKEEGADPLLWGAGRAGDKERQEGAGDPLSRASSLADREEVPDTLGKRTSGRL
ncbi:hypothetical protein KFL_002390160 [Klebsormidium nitens]|uniref:Maspardin n=1 Tax=Klebsormidium nitens TaxID=105231 RepID=A0A1Y1I3L3_KLENI|nr:hypothetical protein KFL_002390160 [Klebsormidium nitens]|eukprot:GAQ85524.1 hypothetical protein KFL_002390160 [Klebsormidium nitens]